jgi:chromosome segregation ATPase
MTRTAKSIAILFSIVALMFAGCTATQRPPASPKAADPEGTARRFRDNQVEGRTAVESAIELSEKYAKLSDQTLGLKQENQRLTNENENLRQQLTAMDTKLKQTQKELTEANDLLVEMLSELNQWKSNILGFRGEMRDAAKAQLEALLKVLEILGGEAEAGVIQQQHAGTLDANTNNPPNTEAPALSQGSEPNGLQ